MKLFKTITFLLLVQISFGQTSPNFITKKQALEDLKVFEITIKEIHPNIYRYTPKIEFDIAFYQARNSFQETVSIREFYNSIAPLIAMVRCGHTFDLARFADAKRGLLPIEVKILDNKIIVLRNLSLPQPQAGCEIISINGISSDELLTDFRNKSIGDGFVTTWKDRTIEKDFKWKFANFINQPDSFKIRYRDVQNSELKQVTLSAESYDSITLRLKSLGLPRYEKPLDFFVDTQNNLAVLKLRSFMAQSIRKQSGQNLKKTIKKSFRSLHKSKIDNLIIDVRWNTGGMAYAAPLLFSYLTDNSFKFKRKIIFRHGYNFTYPEYLNRNKFDDWFNRKLDKKINDTTYEWTHHKNTRHTYKASKKAFHGNLYILINGMTASAGTEFASLAKENGKGIFVGEESGGDYNGVNGGERTYLILPNSKIGILIAGERSIMAWEETKNIGHGVIPNYEVYPTIDDLITGQDTEMNYVYQLIKNK